MTAGLMQTGDQNQCLWRYTIKVSRPDHDPLTLRERLDAALIAAAPGGEITPAIDIATELIQPGLVTRLCGQVLAKALVDLSV